MMRPRRASVIATLSLLAWAATASAECAWTVWGYVSVIDDRGGTMAASWTPMISTSSEQECRAAIKPPSETKEKSSSGRTLRKFTSFHCLSDSVDPRGAKGKSLGDVEVNK
jgi:hypothetical protein